MFINLPFAQIFANSINEGLLEWSQVFENSLQPYAFCHNIKTGTWPSTEMTRAILCLFSLFFILHPSFLNRIFTWTLCLLNEAGSIQYFVSMFSENCFSFLWAINRQFLLHFCIILMMYFPSHFLWGHFHYFMSWSKTFQSHPNPSHYLKNTVVMLVKAGGNPWRKSQPIFCKPLLPAC